MLRLLPRYVIDEPKYIALGGTAGVEVRCHLYIIDLDRPKNKPVYMGCAFGTGFNFGWSCDSAQTVAIKLVLIRLFGGACEDTELEYAEDKCRSVYMSPEQRQAAAEANKAVSDILDPHKKTPSKAATKVKVKPDAKLLVDLPADPYWPNFYLTALNKKRPVTRPNAVLNKLTNWTKDTYMKPWPESEADCFAAIEALA